MSKRAEARRAASAAAGSARLFAALGDETRMRLVRRLCRGGPASIARLTEGSAVTRQAVSKHLAVLARAGLVRGSRRGREHVWRLEPGRLAEAQDWLAAISAGWDAALERLRLAVEEEGLEVGAAAAPAAGAVPARPRGGGRGGRR